MSGVRRGRDDLKKLTHCLHVFPRAESFVQGRHVFLFARLLGRPAAYKIAETLDGFGDESERTVCLRVL
jgi:hypothetical protein